ncbi:MAG: right-handed parallel beta-helix repeat-containing protein [Chitinispirillaceae bacterium]|nr:right-handed parallel beta-helix repeat-containing protein [Chitinispirillaceae bacterium]
MLNLSINPAAVFRRHLPLLLLSLAGVINASGLTFNEKKQRYVLDSSIIVTYSVVIPSGKTLIIKPGVTVQFDGYRSFAVLGLIIAEGTADKPIIFTALDRPRGSREPPQWKGFEIIGRKSSARLKHCRFEGAYRNLAWESSPTFDSCDFAGNHYGLYCADKAAPHVNNCRFFHNSYGIAVDHAFPLLVDNMVTDNRIGLYLQFCSEAIANKNVIIKNETNIRLENALGKNPSSFSLQKMWDLMQQLY